MKKPNNEVSQDIAIDMIIDFISNCDCEKLANIFEEVFSPVEDAYYDVDNNVIRFHDKWVGGTCDEETIYRG